MRFSRSGKVVETYGLRNLRTVFFYLSNLLDNGTEFGTIAPAVPQVPVDIDCNSGCSLTP